MIPKAVRLGDNGLQNTGSQRLLINLAEILNGASVAVEDCLFNKEEASVVPKPDQHQQKLSRSFKKNDKTDWTRTD